MAEGYSSFVKRSCVLFIENQNELIFKRKHMGTPLGLGAGFCIKLISLLSSPQNCHDCQAFLPLVTRCSFLHLLELLSSLPWGLSDSALRYCRLEFLLTIQPHAPGCLVTMSQAQLWLVQPCLTSWPFLPESRASGSVCSGKLGFELYWLHTH